VLAKDSKQLGTRPQALGPAVIPFDENLELIRVEDVAAHTDAEARGKKLDPIPSPRYAREHRLIRINSVTVELAAVIG
jgi:hypothetical protein